MSTYLLLINMTGSGSGGELRVEMTQIHADSGVGLCLQNGICSGSYNVKSFRSLIVKVSIYICGALVSVTRHGQVVNVQ